MTRLARRKIRLIGVLGVVLAVGAAAACSGSGAQWNAPGGSNSTAPAPGEAVLTISHKADATNVSPADPVTVTIANGTLDDVVLINPDNKAVKGEFSADKSSWQTTEELGYNRKYTLKAKGSGLDGRSYEDSRSFTTVKPAEYTRPYLRANVSRCSTVALRGQSAIVVTGATRRSPTGPRRACSLTVTTDPPASRRLAVAQQPRGALAAKSVLAGRYEVTVEASLRQAPRRRPLRPGRRRPKATFTIGRKKIAIADSKTHRMKVYIDDVLVKTINGRDTTLGIPISMGKGGSEIGANGTVVSYTTNSGPHVITTKHEVYRMTSASFGITDPDSPNFYDEKIKKSIRISGDGEFVHLADWNIWAHGKTNTSHGCINVAPAYIYWFYDTFAPVTSST
jgi:lipoprotein-anchoring transpeptidase ErfK/SrfK